MAKTDKETTETNKETAKGHAGTQTKQSTGGNDSAEIGGVGGSNGKAGRTRPITDIEPEPAKPKRTRGRPKGSRNKSSGESNAGQSGSGSGKDNIDAGNPRAVAAICMPLCGIHSLLARVLDEETMNLSDEEAKAIASGMLNVIRHYDFVTDEKTLDIIALFSTLSMVYAPRMMILKNKKKQKKSDNKTIMKPDS